MFRLSTPLAAALACGVAPACANAATDKAVLARDIAEQIVVTASALRMA